MSRRVYLIDYENVNSASALDFTALSEDDSVHLFYTNHVIKISLDIIQKLKCKFRVHKVKAGKQHVDMHLISYLGYSIGRHGEKRSYVIISKDKDYQSTIDSWKEQLGVDILRVPTIADALKEDEAQEISEPEVTQAEPETIAEEAPAEENKEQRNPRGRNSSKRRNSSRRRNSGRHQAQTEAEENTTSEEASSEDASQKRAQSEQKIKINNDITKALGKLMETKDLGHYTSQIMKLYGTKEFKIRAYRDLVKILGQQKGREAYSLIKEML